MAKSICFIFLILFFPLGCATDHPLHQGPEKGMGQVELSEKQDALAKKLNGLEQSISRLQSEVKLLENQLKQMKVRP